MAQVPQYQPNVNERPILQTNLTTRATPDDMGAGIGRGLQQIGQGAQQAASAMAELKALEDQMRAKEADNAFAAWKREADYGDGGFLTLQGQAAVDGRPDYERVLAEKRREFGAGLTGGAAQMYGNASQARVNSALDTSIVHAAQERKTWFAEATAARLNTFSEDAVAAYRDPAKVDFNIAAGQAEIRQQGQMMGWDADTLKNRENEYVSEVRLNTALRTLADDPIAAKAYYDRHKGSITGPHQFKFEEAVKVPLTLANVTKNTAGFFGGSGATPSSATSSYYDSIRAAESSGNDSAKNPNSSATGRYQFTAGTWAGMMRNHPSLGLTSDGRLDPEQQERAIKVFTEENSRVLSRSGIAITNGTLYAAHFLGSFGAVRALRASPEAQMEDVVAPGVIKANSFLRGMTVGQFASWAEEKGNGGGVATAASTAPAAGGYNTIEPYLNSITDPTERDLTRKAIYAQLDAQQQAETQQKKAVQGQAFNLIETQNISPFSLPAEVTTQIGIDGMTTLMSYWEKKQSGQKIQTDDELLYEMQKAYAVDPKAFAEVDLLQFRDRLDDDAWKTVTGFQQTALTDQRKAGEEGLALSTAYSGASTALEAAGITTTGKEGDDRTSAAKQIAQFQNVLTQQIAAFRAENERNPNDAEVQAITNRLLLPVVIKPTNVDSGVFGNHFFGVGLPQPKEGFLFEAETRPDGTVVDVAVEYADIPTDLRETLRASLTQELGRAPTEEEIVSEYEVFFLGLDK